MNTPTILGTAQSTLVAPPPKLIKGISFGMSTCSSTFLGFALLISILATSARDED
jgi:hypothetical protein